MKHECTITLKPLMYRLDAKSQFEHTMPYIRGIFKLYKSTVVCELTQEHNVHYHAIIELNDAKHKNEFLNQFRRVPHIHTFGRKTCSVVKYEQSYEDYLFKDIAKTEQLVEHDPVIKDDYKIRPATHTLKDTNEVRLYVNEKGRWELVKLDDHQVISGSILISPEETKQRGAGGE